MSMIIPYIPFLFNLGIAVYKERPDVKTAANTISPSGLFLANVIPFYKIP